MLLSRGVFRGGYGGSWISEIYAFWGGFGLPPPKKKKNCKPSLEKKPAYASLNIFKTISSSQPLLNLSKYKSEDQEIYFNLKTGPFVLDF